MNTPHSYWSKLACMMAMLVAIPSAFGQEIDTKNNTTELPLEVVTPEATTPKTEKVQPAVESGIAMIDENGTLSGFIYRIDGDQKVPVEAKVTLSKNGKVVETASTDESGTFSIANVEPGTYDMFAAADSFVGAQTYDVQGFSSQFTGASAVDLQLGGGQIAAPAAVYDNFGSMPLQSFAAAPSCSSCANVAPACGSCGGGGIGGGGGLFRGALGGNRRLLRLGLVGGVVAIATSDASPDN